MKSLYEKLTEAGIPTSNHESDLYFRRNQESLKILAEFPIHHRNATVFFNQVELEMWMEVPFAYLPYWEKKQKND